MPLYEVSLSRTFVIRVEAKSAQDAAEVSEFLWDTKMMQPKTIKKNSDLDFKV
jgi:hypothetical protein